MLTTVKTRRIAAYVRAFAVHELADTSPCVNLAQTALTKMVRAEDNAFRAGVNSLELHNAVYANR